MAGEGAAGTTEKDGSAPALLAAERPARANRDAVESYHQLALELGEPAYDRKEAHASLTQKKILAALTPAQVGCADLAGEKIRSIITEAPGNHAPIGGVKVSTETGWFAARPSGTEDIYKIYAESFRGVDQLDKILAEAQVIVDTALASGAPDATRSP